MEEEDDSSAPSQDSSAPALLALHPLSRYVALAVGTQLRIFNLEERCSVIVNKTSGLGYHEDAIRAIRFSRDGNLFASVGDDKLVKLWDTESWRCIKTLHANKKISATSFSHNGEWLLYADKFGVVYAVSTMSEEGVTAKGQSVQLLAHCCSIITSMDCSSDGRFIVTADRDFKIRVSIFPEDPLKGAHEIEGFCLGHTNFVSCIAFLGGNTHQLLVSGGGDSTVRLWDVESTRLLDTFDVAIEADLNNNDEGDQSFSVTCIAVLNNGSLIAVGVESLDGVLLIKFDFESKKLSLLQKLLLPEHFCPTSLQFDTKGQVWLVAGAAQKPQQKVVTWVKLLSSEGNGYKPVANENIPGGSLLLETIDGVESEEEKALALSNTGSAGLKNQLSKRQYTHEQREFRKRMRNDKKLQKMKL